MYFNCLGTPTTLFGTDSLRDILQDIFKVRLEALGNFKALKKKG